MGEQVEKRKITPVLLKMEVENEERFPIEQLDSINTAIQRQQSKHIRRGLKWSARKSDCGLEVIVTRVS
ncbi:MAG: hypothetical protein RSH25_14805 [Bacteroides sp.]|uniref:hypothetical protein n=1 Tax=Bacteroides sp. TaxID=29523 RepID=UPI002FC62D71